MHTTPLTLRTLRPGLQIKLKSLDNLSPEQRAQLRGIFTLTHDVPSTINEVMLDSFSAWNLTNEDGEKLGFIPNAATIKKWEIIEKGNLIFDKSYIRADLKVRIAHLMLVEKLKEEI